MKRKLYGIIAGSCSLCAPMSTCATVEYTRQDAIYLGYGNYKTLTQKGYGDHENY
jgi:hypothetical protein